MSPRTRRGAAPRAGSGYLGHARRPQHTSGDRAQRRHAPRGCSSGPELRFHQWIRVRHPNHRAL